MDDVKVSVEGNELELHTVSAREYLFARMEAEELSGSWSDDPVTKALLLGAALLSRGLYDGGERAFESADDVLDRMSAEEIVALSGYVDIQLEEKQRIVNAENKADDEREQQETEKEREASEPVELRIGRKSRSESVTAYKSAEFANSEVKKSGTTTHRAAMRQVSDFFERDSRRYDGIISCY